MKKKQLLLFILLTPVLIWAQTPESKVSRYSGGISAYYLQISPELNSYSSQNWIDGESFGWNDWDESEISDLNNYVSTTQTWVSPSLIFRMNILDNPESPWLFVGEFMLGYLFHEHNEVEESSEIKLLEVKTDGGMNFFSSINCKMQYSLQKWNLAITPVLTAGIIHSERIVYDYLDEASYDTKYEIQSKMFFPKVNLTGGYSFNTVSVYAGAGFGSYYTKQNLDIIKSTPYQTFKDELSIVFTGKSNINAIVGFDWLIAEKFLWQFESEIGMGIEAQASLSILF